MGEFDECKELILCCYDDVFLKSCTILMLKIYMRELFYVTFCMLSFHLWIIRPEEYPGVLPIIVQEKICLGT